MVSLGVHSVGRLVEIMKKYIYIIPLLLLCGCTTTKPVKQFDISPLSAQINKLSEANSDLREANERLTVANFQLSEANDDLKAMLRADAEAGLAANANGWLPFERYVWQHQLTLLPGPPDEVTSSKWAEAAGPYASDGEAAMQGIVSDLHASAEKQSFKLDKLSSTIEQLAHERDAAQEAASLAQMAVLDANDSMASAIEQARQASLQDVRNAQVAWANRFGGYAAIGALLAGIGIYWLGEGAVIAFLGLGASSVLLFGYARFLGWPYYGWAVGGISAIIAILAIFYLMRIASMKSKASRYGTFGKVIVPALDDIYEDKSKMADWLISRPEATQSDFIESRLFDKLSNTMDSDTKAVVDEIRAANKVAQ